MRATLAFALLVLAWVTPAWTAVTMDHMAISTTGGTMRNGQLQMDLTVGQPVIGSALSGSVLTQLGFWWQVVSVTVDVDDDVSPTSFAFRQNAPNPFTTRTSVTFAIPQGPTPVFLGVFSLNGRLVKTLVNESKDPGVYTVIWDGRDDAGRFVSAGLYFASIHANAFSQTRKIVMLK